MKKLNEDEFLELFDPSVHGKLSGMYGRSDVVALVVFENRMMDSSRFGERTAVAVGPGCTYKTVAEVEKLHLGDVPSRFQHPVAYVGK